MWVNNSEFLIKDSEIPTVPIEFSQDALQWYQEQKRRCIEGYWVGGKWMPPNLYFYVNFWKILLNRGKSKTKILARPWLRDVEWELLPNWIIARGFSGFEGHKQYTHEELINKMPYFGESGKPLYENQAKDLMCLGPREWGKSFMASGGIVAHEWIFNGAKEYKVGDKQNTTNITVGAGDYKYSTKLLEKVKMGLDALQRGGIDFNGRFYPHPFMQSYSGTFSSGKSVVAEYKKKIGGTWQNYGTGSRINHISYKDNVFAGQGGRNSVMVKEEVGMHQYLIQCQEADRETMMNGTNKFGSCLYIGCVCAGTKVYTGDGRVINIEDLKKEDGIIGFNGNNSVKQRINYFNPPQKKECVRIYTDNGNVIECSSDHPFLTTKRKSVSCGVKISTFTLADKIEVKHQILSPSSVPIFGNVEVKNARLIGLLIGDGNYSGGTVSLSISEKEILDFVEPLIITKNKKYKISESRDYCQASLCPEIKKQLLENKMYGQSKDKKRLPKDIHTYSKESLAELLGGYFDADGNVYYNKKKDITRIVLTSVVMELLEEVKYQLLKFGIHCSIFKENRNTEPSYEYRGQNDYICRLYITQQQDIKLFSKNIKLLVKDKNDKIICKKSKYGLTKSIFRVNPENNKEHYFNRETKSDELNNLRYETVVKVEKIGLRDVYNLNCNDNHNYVCNSLISSQTGGDMDKGTMDAYKMFYAPETYDLLTFEDKWENKGSIGMFVSAVKRPNEFKDDQGNTDEVKSLEYFMSKRKELRSSKGGAEQLDSFIQYNPLVPSEVFLRTNNNIFPVAEMKDWLAELETNPIYVNAETICDIYFDEFGKPQIKINPELRSIYKFPLDKNDDTTGAITIYHHPEMDQLGNIADNRYWAGIDPYDVNKAQYSTSLGSMMVYDKMSGRLVCEYTGRPKFADQFYENCRKVLLYYNAIALYENEKSGVKQYFEKKNSLYLLMTQPKYIKDVIPSSTVERGYGMHMNKQLKDHGEILLRDWLNTEEDGVLNVRKIRSIPLLKELIMYDDDGNFDRVIAYMMVMYALQETHKQKIIYATDFSKDKFFERKLFQKNTLRYQKV